MRGARAILAVRRAEVLGLVSGVRPSLVQLEREEFDGRVGFRIESRADATRSSTAAIRTAGEVQHVRFEEPALSRSGRRARSGTARSASISGGSTA